MERGVLAFSCQCIVSPRGRTGNRTVTQMRRLILVEGRPNCTRQSLASTVSAPRVAATSYCDPGRHANVVTPCLLTPCLNVPNLSEAQPKQNWTHELCHDAVLKVLMRLHTKVHTKDMNQYIGSNVMQSGFGVNFLFWSGEF